MANGDPAPSFDGWTIELFVVRRRGLNGPEALADAAALHLTVGAGLALAVPNVLWPMRDEDWETLGARAGDWWYELWRTDAPRSRLAYGRLVFID
jgi:hypothetical protein